jgi:tRNA-dihydrouridine synthase
VPERPVGAALAAVVAEHLEAHLAFYGEPVGLRAFRKHLYAYCSGLRGSEDLRNHLIRLSDPGAVLRLVRTALPDFDALPSPALQCAPTDRAEAGAEGPELVRHAA